MLKRRERILLTALEALMGPTAIGCGIILATGHAESLLDMDVDLLAGTPFDSYLIPGVILAAIVGGSEALAAAGLLLRTWWADVAAFFSGTILMGWIAGQMLLIGWSGPWWQQPVYFSYGLAISALAWRIAGGRELRNQARLAVVRLTPRQR